MVRLIASPAWALVGKLAHRRDRALDNFVRRVCSACTTRLISIVRMGDSLDESCRLKNRRDRRRLPVLHVPQDLIDAVMVFKCRPLGGV